MTIQEIFTGEKDNIEYKVDIPPKSENYMRTVVAYANTKGGRLVFGVEDNTWRVVGFTKEEVFQKMDAITNAIYDSCEPKISPDVAIQEFEGKYIIVIDIPAGMQRPYCIKSQGIIDGVYLRVSGTTRKAAIYQIQEMTLFNRNRSYDSEKVNRELSENELMEFCSRLYTHAKELCVTERAKAEVRRIGIGQLISFKVICEEKGKYYATNGYQLLDGKLEAYPDAVIQCAVFKGTTRDIFITRKEFAGCIDEEIESAYAFVLEHINLGARIDGLVRQDIYELPIRTIREIITNAICHRSYLCPGKVQVVLFDDRLEVTSPGMLDRDLTIEKVKAGISKVRNGAIAKVFAYMNMIEAWGTGIPRMFQEAKDYGLREPEIQDMGSDFRVNLYRKEVAFDPYGVVEPKEMPNIAKIHEGYEMVHGPQTSSNGTKTGTNGTKTGTNGTKTGSRVGTSGTKVGTKTIGDEEKILAVIYENEKVTQKQMEQKTGLSLRTIKRIIARLQRNGKLVRIGSSRSGRWQVLGNHVPSSGEER